MEAHLDLAVVYSFGKVGQTHYHLFLSIEPLFYLVENQPCAILERLLQSSLERRSTNISRTSPSPPFDDGLPLLLTFDLLY